LALTFARLADPELGGTCALLGGPDKVSIHTDATQLGPWERFRVVRPRASIGQTP
jgi:hypothetical protein